MAEEDIYTNDGTTDFRNKPTVLTETGTWKACPYILRHDSINNVSICSWTKSELRGEECLPSNRIANWGALVAASVLVWVQTNVAWGWGFGIPTVTMAIAILSFFSGTRLDRNQRPGASPLTRFCQETAVKGSRELDHTEQLSILDKAAVETQSDRIKGSINPGRLCTVTQVEELKSITRLLPIWATGIIFSAVCCPGYLKMYIE
ncbi:hypothetical protein SLEP1_g17924 [Rubroshorea leprosula]|uniref:Uncharacterized protein n=1 Tax=Rubroshorea leprosula TaxID=152421 RepID=A0AAV5J7K4_9ROSI|nr:hypothetical protein SLEP1_g17924 [Rubroshorea leprosula]